MPIGYAPVSNDELDGDLAETKWVVEVKTSDDPTCGRRRVRVFHYGQLVENRWTYDWVYPENTGPGEEEFYISITPDQIFTPEDDDVPCEDRGGNVGLWIKITDAFDNGASPTIDMYYVGNEANQDQWICVPRYHYDVLFATEQEIVG